MITPIPALPLRDGVCIMSWYDSSTNKIMYSVGNFIADSLEQLLCDLTANANGTARDNSMAVVASAA